MKINKKTLLAELENITTKDCKFIIKSNRLQIISYNKDILKSNYIYIDNYNKLEEEFIVNVKEFIAFIKQQAVDVLDVSLNKENNNLIVNECFFCLANNDIYNCVDFNKLPDCKDFIINSKDFYNSINNCIDAASRDDARYYLNGICFNNEHSVATDGTILIQAAPIHQQEHDFILPLDACKLLLKTLKNTDAKITCRKSRLYIVFEFENTFIMCKLICAEYPKYKRVIPYGNDIELKTYIKDIKNLKSMYTVLTDKGFFKYSKDFNKNDYKFCLYFELNIFKKLIKNIKSGFITIKICSGVNCCRAPIYFEKEGNVYVIMPERPENF